MRDACTKSGWGSGEGIEVGNIGWSEVATASPGRIGKQCRERWFNHLDPSIRKVRSDSADVYTGAPFFYNHIRVVPVQP